MMSVRRISRLSACFPPNPAIMPMTVPIIRMITAGMRPTAIDTRAP